MMGPLTGSIRLTIVVLMRILETTSGPMMSSMRIIKTFKGSINPEPRNATTISGVIARAPKYAPIVPIRAKSLSPLRKKAKGITATAGGTEARMIKPVLKSELWIKKLLSPRRIPP